MFTDVVMDDKPVLVNCFVYTPDIVVVMDETIIQKHVDVSKGITDETILVLNASSEAVARKYQEAFPFRTVYYVNATQVALDNIGKGIPNGSTLGALAKTGVVSIESVEKALIEFLERRQVRKMQKQQETATTRQDRCNVQGRAPTYLTPAIREAGGWNGQRWTTMPASNAAPAPCTARLM
mgnify:CR=1 FL=1